MAQDIIHEITLWEPDLGSDLTPAPPQPTIWKQIERFVITEKEKEIEVATITFSRGAYLPLDTVLTERTVFKVQYGDPAVSWKLFRVVKIDFDATGKRGAVVTCRAMWSDLKDVVIRQTRTGGFVDLSVTLVGQTLSQALTEIIAADHNLPSTFVMGTVNAQVDTIGAEPVRVHYFAVTFLQVLNDLASQIATQTGYGAEYEFVWNNATGKYSINFYAELGWSAAELTAGVEDPTSRTIHGPNGVTDHNRLDMSYVLDSQAFFNRVIPISGSEEELVDISKAEFYADAESPAGTINLEAGNRIVAFANQHAGLYLGNDSVGFSLINTSTPDNAGKNAFTTAGSETAMVGEWLRFAINSGGDPVVYIDDSTVTAHGAVEKIQSFEGISPYPNLLVRANVSASMDDFTGGLCNGWVELGNPTTTENTDTQFFKIGDGSQKVVTILDNEGIEASFEVAVDPANPYISCWVNLRSDGTNLVRIEFIDSAGQVFPDTERAESNVDELRGIALGGFEPAPGTATLRIYAPEAATTFYVDAVAVTQSTSAWEYADKMGPALLFEEGVKYLAEKGGVLPAAVSGSFLDVTAIKAGTEVLLGSHVEYRDVYSGGGGPIVSVDSRVKEVVTTEGKFEGRFKKQIRLSTKRADFTGRWRGVRRDVPPIVLPKPADKPTTIKESIVRRGMWFATDAEMDPTSSVVYPAHWGAWVKRLAAGRITPGRFEWVEGEGLEKYADSTSHQVTFRASASAQWGSSVAHTMYFLCKQTTVGDNSNLIEWTGDDGEWRIMLRNSVSRVQWLAVNDVAGVNTGWATVDTGTEWFVLAVRQRVNASGTQDWDVRVVEPDGTFTRNFGTFAGNFNTGVTDVELYGFVRNSVASTLLYTAYHNDAEITQNMVALIDYANELELTATPWDYGGLLTPVMERPLGGPVVDLQFQDTVGRTGGLFFGADTGFVFNYGSGSARGQTTGDSANFAYDPRGDGIIKLNTVVGDYVKVDDPLGNGKAALSNGGYTVVAVTRIKTHNVTADVWAEYRSASLQGVQSTVVASNDYEMEFWDDTAASSLRHQFSANLYADEGWICTFFTLDIDGVVTGTARNAIGGLVGHLASEYFDVEVPGAGTFTVDHFRLLKGNQNSFRRFLVWDRPMSVVELEAQVRTTLQWCRQFPAFSLDYQDLDIITIGERNDNIRQLRLLQSQGFDFGDLVDVFPLNPIEADPGIVFGAFTGVRGNFGSPFSLNSEGFVAPVNHDAQFVVSDWAKYWEEHETTLTDFTMTAVFKSEGTGASFEAVVGMSSGSNVQQRVHIQYHETSGSLRAYIYDDVFTSGGFIQSAAAAVPVGKWGFYVVTWQKSSRTLDFYLQGEDDTSLTFVNTITATALTYDETPSGVQFFDTVVAATHGPTTNAFLAFHNKYVDQDWVERNLRAITNVLRSKNINFSTNDTESAIEGLYISDGLIRLEVKKSEGQALGTTTAPMGPGAEVAIPITATPFPLKDGDTIAIAYETSGVEYLDTFTVETVVPEDWLDAGVTSIPITSQAPSATIPTGSEVFEQLSSTFNQIRINTDDILLTSTKTSNVAIALINGPWNPADPTTTINVQSIDTWLIDGDKLRVAYSDAGVLYNVEATVNAVAHVAPLGTPTTIPVDSVTFTGTVPDGAEVIYVDSFSRGLLQISPGKVLMEASESASRLVVAGIGLAASIVDGAHIEIKGVTTFASGYNPNDSRAVIVQAAPAPTKRPNGVDDVIIGDQWIDTTTDRIAKTLTSTGPNVWSLDLTTIDGGYIKTGIINANLVEVNDDGSGSPGAWINGSGFGIETGVGAVSKLSFERSGIEKGYVQMFDNAGDDFMYIWAEDRFRLQVGPTPVTNIQVDTLAFTIAPPTSGVIILSGSKIDLSSVTGITPAIGDKIYMEDVTTGRLQSLLINDAPAAGEVLAYNVTGPSLDWVANAGGGTMSTWDIKGDGVGVGIVNEAEQLEIKGDGAGITSTYAADTLNHDITIGLSLVALTGITPAALVDKIVMVDGDGNANAKANVTDIFKGMTEVAVVAATDSALILSGGITGVVRPSTLLDVVEKGIEEGADVTPDGDLDYIPILDGGTIGVLAKSRIDNIFKGLPAAVTPATGDEILITDSTAGDRVASVTFPLAVAYGMLNGNTYDHTTAVNAAEVYALVSAGAVGTTGKIKLRHLIEQLAEDLDELAATPAAGDRVLVWDTGFTDGAQLKWVSYANLIP